MEKVIVIIINIRKLITSMHYWSIYNLYLVGSILQIFTLNEK